MVDVQRRADALGREQFDHGDPAVGRLARGFANDGEALWFMGALATITPSGVCPRRRRAWKRGRGHVFLSETLRDEPNDAREANAARLSI
jgi:hypothetical protein